MSSKPYLYLMSFLPALDGLEVPPAMKLEDFWSRLCEIGGDAQPAVELVFTRLDVLALIAALTKSGTDAEALAFALSPEQLEGNQDLPEWMGPWSFNDKADWADTDRLWHAYYTRGLEIARQSGSRLLEKYIIWDINLANALAYERCSRMGVSPEQFVLNIPEAEGVYERQDFSEIISRWKQEKSVMESEKSLDRARWAFIEENIPYFTFAADEVTGYALRLALAARWGRIDAARGAQILEDITG